MNNEIEKPSLMLNELVYPEMSQVAFDRTIAQLLTSKDKEVFEDSVTASRVFAVAVICSAVFAPYPAKFDSDIFTDVVKETVGLKDMNVLQTNRIINFCINTGLLKETEDNYLTIPDQRLYDTISTIGDHHY